ncbi:RNA recognition motif domain-containing protein [Ditylenchus destructor]|nr:RNA recognition motif domain-containing protein [Ditylenchus destructor]
MSSLRNILQRCARKASLKSILGSTPLQIQCTFNPVYSAYPTSISRQAYSSDANEAPKNEDDPVQKYFLEFMNSRKPHRDFVKDQKAPNSFTADSAQKTPFGQIDLTKSPPSVTEDQKEPKNPIFNKNLNLRKYYVNIRGLSINTTPESLREFYSQFGEIMDRALDSLPHCIDGKETNSVGPVISLGKKQRTLMVLDLSPKTTPESLKAFYSKFGWLDAYYVDQGANGKVGKVTFANQEDMHRALDAQPHIIDGSEVFLKYATFDLDLVIEDMPEGTTDEELIAFYSKYGQLRECRFYKGKYRALHAYVSYSAIDEVNRAMADRPHIVCGKPLKIRFITRFRGSIPVSLVVGSLPENVTEETLREEFSKYGKLVYWILNNDGQFNQSGPYGIVSYGSEEEALKALNSGPHTVEGSVVDQICDTLNIENPDGPRKTIEQIRTKFKNTKQRAKQEFQEKKRHQGATGGGPPKKQNSCEMLDKVQDMYDGTPSFSGLTTGMETSIFTSPTSTKYGESKIKQESLHELQRKVLVEQLAFYQQGGQAHYRIPERLHYLANSQNATTQKISINNSIENVELRIEKTAAANVANRRPKPSQHKISTGAIQKRKA